MTVGATHRKLKNIFWNEISFVLAKLNIYLYLEKADIKRKIDSMMKKSN